jgi:very-short-patch-repair endonuclease
VYVPAAVELTKEVRWRAALAWAGTSSALSHRSAGEFWKLDTVHAPKPELVVPGPRHPRSPEVAVHRTTQLTPADVVRREALRVTSPTRTIIDLAASLDASTLRVAFESARRRRLTSVDAVRSRLAALGTGGRPGAQQLGELLAMLDGRAPSESPLEAKVHELLERTGLPRAVPQFVVTVEGVAYRLDFAWPASRVALECDGRERHFEDTDFRRDRRRWSALAAAGWRTVFVTWHDLAQFDDVLEQLRGALAA